MQSRLLVLDCRKPASKNNFEKFTRAVRDSGTGFAISFDRSHEITTQAKAGVPMSQRDINLLWLKDTLEHLVTCQQQLAWAKNAEAVQVLTESMLRDLECCRRICETLHQRASLQHAC